MLYLFNYVSATGFAQEDSTSRHGTIRIGKVDEKIYVRTFSDFKIYYNDPVNELTYEDFVLNINQRNPVKRSARFVTNEAIPKYCKDSVFDYTEFFENDQLIQSIRFQKDETDTVRLLIYVDVKGIVKFIDLAYMEKRGKDLWVYDLKKKEYKVDKVHEKTGIAFSRLTLNPWIPAKVKTLKKHPSRHKVKYDSADGYMQGILTIIYSGSTLN